MRPVADLTQHTRPKIVLPLKIELSDPPRDSRGSADDEEKESPSNNPLCTTTRRAKHGSSDTLRESRLQFNTHTLGRESARVESAFEVVPLKRARHKKLRGPPKKRT